MSRNSEPVTTREPRVPGPSRLRVLQVSTADRAGGAERSAWNLFQAYRDRGHDSWLAVGRKYTDDPDVIVIPNKRRETLWSRVSGTSLDRLTRFERHVPGFSRMRQWLEPWLNPWL